MVITRLCFSYKIQCHKCAIWQSFEGSLPKSDMALRHRIERWICRLCGAQNITTYELGLNTKVND